MSQLRARTVDMGELDEAVQLAGGLSGADDARMNLARLGGLAEEMLTYGEGWAIAVEVDGATLLARGEPKGKGAKWTISAAPGTSGGEHAAKRLQILVGQENLS